MPRRLNLQLGLLRGPGPPTVQLAMGNVTVLSNLFGVPRTAFGPNDKRVFFWQDSIHTRTQFLHAFNIDFRSE